MEDLPARQPQYALPGHPLSEPVQAALVARGINQMFTHQAQAVDAVMAGKNVVVSTSTASGKSLCYNIPILEALVQDRQACALYMFPTKVNFPCDKAAMHCVCPGQPDLCFLIVSKQGGRQCTIHKSAFQAGLHGNYHTHGQHLPYKLHGMASRHAKFPPLQRVVTSLVSQVQCRTELPSKHLWQSSTVCFSGLQALAQDQLRALRQMCAAAFGEDAPHVEVYDGDTIRVNTLNPHTEYSTHALDTTPRDMLDTFLWLKCMMELAVLASSTSPPPHLRG